MDPRFTDRLAKIYVSKLINHGNDTAKAWAEKFLGKDDILAVAIRVKEILKKRGFKVPD